MKIKIVILTVLVASTVVVAAQAPQQSAECWKAIRETAVTDRAVYGYLFDKKNAYINISKTNRTLYVYERRCTGPMLIAAYPVCLGANRGDKERRGDCRTPESKEGKPFVICSIEDASTWTHDFGDGRGEITAYGSWFMRLRGDFAGSGIGIHGSTGNRYSVPGRGSEGCIRLRDEDLIHLKENYAYIGMDVYIGKDEN